MMDERAKSINIQTYLNYSRRASQSYDHLNNSVSACHAAFHVAQQLCVRQQKCKVTGTWFKILRFVAVEKPRRASPHSPTVLRWERRHRLRKVQVCSSPCYGRIRSSHWAFGRARPPILRGNHGHSTVQSYWDSWTSIWFTLSQFIKIYWTIEQFLGHKFDSIPLPSSLAIQSGTDGPMERQETERMERSLGRERADSRCP